MLSTSGASDDFQTGLPSSKPLSVEYNVWVKTHLPSTCLSSEKNFPLGSWGEAWLSKLEACFLLCRPLLLCAPLRLGIQGFSLPHTEQGLAVNSERHTDLWTWVCDLSHLKQVCSHWLSESLGLGWKIPTGLRCPPFCWPLSPLCILLLEGFWVSGLTKGMRNFGPILMIFVPTPSQCWESWKAGFLC